MNVRKNVFWAIPFIVVGIVWLLRNMGMVTFELFDIIVSWQMLLMYVGVGNMLSRHFTGGLITFMIGALFLMPELGWIDSNWLSVNWPITLVVIGIIILLKPLFRKSNHKRHGHLNPENVSVGRTTESFVNTDGYVEIDNTFGSVQQIILDPVFKGARIKTSLGGTILDIRQTKLENPETVIEVDCSLGGIEIYMPAGWRLHFQTNSMLGGCEDKRYNRGIAIDEEHILIIRGNVTLSGIVIKS